MSQSADRTLYITDLDGTLLNADSKVSEESVRLINEAVKAGAMFAAATARTPATVDPLLEGIRPSRTPEGRNVPDVVMTGSAYWNRLLHRYDYIKMMSAKDSDTIVRIFDHYGVNPFLYSLGDNEILEVYHSTSLNPREDAFYQERRHLKLKRFHLGKTPPHPNAVLFFAISTPDKAQEICDKINAATNCSAAWYLDIFNSDVAMIDIYGPSCSKAVAIRDIATTLRANRIVVFGDNLNDLPMMRVADLAVAVENALPQTKAEAHKVIGPNTADSVARFIHEDFFSRR